MRKLLEEIKRRNVFKVAFVYVVAGWVTMQIVDVMFPALHLPDWMTSAIAAMLLIGFPFAMIFAWAFEMTPEGIKREEDVDRSQSVTTNTGRKLNKSAVIILAIAVGFLLIDKFYLQPDAPTSTEKLSIAVLPFVNMSDDADNEYFSDGLSEELLNVLSKIPQLHVAGRTSSFAFKGKTDDLRKIGEQLDVAHILEGSVRKSNTQLRITVQLIDTDSGFHLWSETYDREVTDVFAVQDEISAAVVEALKVTLLGGEIVTNFGTDNPEAYELYLKARYFLEQSNAENLVIGIEAIDRAIELDPDYANAYIIRALFEQQSVSGWAGDGHDFLAGYERIRAYADQAIELDPQSAEAHFVQGMVAATADWEFAAAQSLFRRALELEPQHIPARNWYGVGLIALGQPEDAVLVFEESLRMDPLMITSIRTLGDAHFYAGNYPAAIDAYEDVLELNDTIARIDGRLSRVALMQGDIDAAEAFAHKEEIEWEREYLLILALGRRGKSDEWRAATEAYQEKYGVSNSYQFATLYGDAGYVDEAFEWLEKSRDVHDPGTVGARVDPFLNSLHDDPRWQPFVKSIGVAD